MIPIIQAHELAQFRHNPGFVLVDARTGSDVKERYKISHLEGAIFIDLEEQMADKKPNPAEGGRHPLPDVSKFCKLLGQLGIDPDSHVVVYDDKNGANAAARFWWMLSAVGHQKVQVLDGGIQAALAAGFPTSSQEFRPVSKPAYPSKKWQLPLVDIEQVEKVAQDSSHLVIDVRDEERYRGEKEPIDLIAGHIPGAINVPFTVNLNNKGLYLSPEELKTKYLQILGNRNPDKVIVHCGSGVTACHTLLAMKYAGIEDASLYVGSWSEWSRTDRPIAKEI